MTKFHWILAKGLSGHSVRIAETGVIWRVNLVAYPKGLIHVGSWYWLFAKAQIRWLIGVTTCHFTIQFRLLATWKLNAEREDFKYVCFKRSFGNYKHSYEWVLFLPYIVFLSKIESNATWNSRRKNYRGHKKHCPLVKESLPQGGNFKLKFRISGEGIFFTIEVFCLVDV